MGSLTSELLAIHEGNYVVRALVQVGGTLLTTGMATASDIELAEDRAKVRALEALGLQPSSIAISSPSLAQLPVVEPQRYLASQPTTTDSISAAQLTAPDLSLETPTPANPISPIASPPVWADSTPPPAASPATGSVIADWYSHINTEPEPDPVPSDNAFNAFEADDALPTNRYDIASTETAADAAETREAASPRPRNGKSRPQPIAQPEPTPPVSVTVDLSDVIAQTDVELARLGWNKTQGREHLKRTYGKRSRQELDETELYDFLHYLESQP